MAPLRPIVARTRIRCAQNAAASILGVLRVPSPQEVRCAAPRSSFRARTPARPSSRRRTHGVRSTLPVGHPSLLPARRECAAQTNPIWHRRPIARRVRRRRETGCDRKALCFLAISLTGLRPRNRRCFADGGFNGNRPSLCLLQVGETSALRHASFGSHLHAISHLLRAR
jgi:hypothetical protein